MAETTYTSVTWTAGDVITEAKMDNMVANDRAVDAMAQGIELTERANPATPAADKVHLFLGTDNVVKRIDEGGNVTNLGQSADGWIAAGETWTYAASDDPTYTLTITGDKTTKYSAGMRVKLTDSGTQYFIITDVAYSDPNTTLTLYGGTDYDLSSGTITNPFYSYSKSPHGMPMETDKWQVLVTDTTNRQQNSPTATTWYNPGSISIDIPIGAWQLSYQALGRSVKASVTELDVVLTLGTASNNSIGILWESVGQNYGASGNLRAYVQAHRSNYVELATKDTYYMNVKTNVASTSSISINNDISTNIIKAVCAYL